jgi:transposase
VTPPEALPDDIAALQTALFAERAARHQAEARASGAEAMVAYLKLLIAKMKRERFGQSAERGRKLLDQLELELEELEASAAEDEVAARHISEISNSASSMSLRTAAGAVRRRRHDHPLASQVRRQWRPAPASCG